MRKVRSDFSTELREFTGEDDNVHLLAEYPAEGGGWIDRGRDPADRRGVVIQAARARGAEILRLYLIDSGMNTALDQICAEYDDKDLQLLAGFLHRTADAARTAAERLTTR